MIRLASKILQAKSLSKSLSKNNFLGNSSSKFHIGQFEYGYNDKPCHSHRNLLYSMKYDFSRRNKQQKFEKKLQESLDKYYQDQKSRRKESREKKIFEYSANYLLPFLGFALLFLFVKAHVTKKDQSMKQGNGHFKKISQRGNVNILPQARLRELIASGGAMNWELQVVRKNRMRGSSKYNTFCFLKSVTGQTFAAQITHLTDFLHFVESLPADYKVSFQYESYLQKDLASSPLLSSLFNVALLVVGVIFAKKLYGTVKTMMKNSGGQNMFDVDNKKIEAIKPENINTLFKDVAGMHQAKFQITEFVDFLKEPQKYIEMGAKIPKGALLTGPPGTGKTLLARACAGQAGVPFYYVSGSDFVEKYVGLGASRVRKLFDQAQKNAPSIIFIDEIDAIGKKRDSGPFANEQRDNTLNQLLVRMDGFDTKNKVIVMAATNIKDTLDPALLRPGRFDRAVQIGLPNFQQRNQILQVHLAKVKFDPKFTIQQLANRISILTPGFSGAQLANVCNQGAILAARDGAEVIDLAKFQKATQRVMAGLEKRNLFSDEEKLMLAYYQSGKAVVGWFTQGSDPIIKLSILPFSKASKGYSHTIKDQVGLTTKEQLLGKACFYLAGRAAQNHFQKFVTTNGDSDLKRAKRIFSLIVTKFGMSQKLRNIAFPDTEFVRKPYSSNIQIMIDEQISRFSNQSKQRVQKLISQKSDLIQKLKTKLLQKQTLNHSQIKEILGERPFESDNENYKKYIIEEQKAHQQKAIQGVEMLEQTADKIGTDQNSQRGPQKSGENIAKFEQFKDSL